MASQTTQVIRLTARGQSSSSSKQPSAAAQCHIPVINTCDLCLCQLLQVQGPPPPPETGKAEGRAAHPIHCYLLGFPTTTTAHHQHTASQCVCVCGLVVAGLITLGPHIKARPSPCCHSDLHSSSSSSRHRPPLHSECRLHQTLGGWAGMNNELYIASPIG